MDIRAIIATAAIGVSSLFVGSDTAQAVRIGGHAAVPWSDAGDCVDSAYARLRNTCASTKTFTIPLMVESTGNKALSFRAVGDTEDNDVGCRGQAMTSNNAGYWTTPWTYMSEFGSVQTVDLGTLHVGDDGAAYMRCNIDPDGALLSVEWEQ